MTVNTGLRWDHYQLVVNQNAVSPRFSVARYFPAANLLVHASYDRVFQTPSFENILLASSPSVVALNPQVLRFPIEPSHGNYFELAPAKASSASSASMPTISAVMSTTSPMTTRSLTLPSASP